MRSPSFSFLFLAFVVLAIYCLQIKGGAIFPPDLTGEWTDCSYSSHVITQTPLFDGIFKLYQDGTISIENVTSPSTASSGKYKILSFNRVRLDNGFHSLIEGHMQMFFAEGSQLVGYTLENLGDGNQALTLHANSEPLTLRHYMLCRVSSN